MVLGPVNNGNIVSKVLIMTERILLFPEILLRFIFVCASLCVYHNDSVSDC